MEVVCEWRTVGTVEKVGESVVNEVALMECAHCLHMKFKCFASVLHRLFLCAAGGVDDRKNVVVFM
jgi:hypothetical protein